MAIKLRPHHLLCMLTFAGKGYSPEFVRNFEEIVRRVASGTETIEFIDGPDDICAAMLNDPENHCRNASVTARDLQAAESLGSLLGQQVHAGEWLLLSTEILENLRRAFAEGTVRQACGGCQWRPLCDAISQNGFKETWLVRLETIAGTEASSKQKHCL